MNSKETSSTSNSFLWDLFCIGSIVGIWPRYIEPSLIRTTRLQINTPELPGGLDGFKILQISDLHLNQNLSDRYLDRVVKKAEKLSPDLIVMTGDFLCYSYLADPERLEKLLNRFKAPYGCYAVLGNHDYAECVSINEHGDYDAMPPPSSSLNRAFLRLTKNVTLTKVITERAKKIALHPSLIALLEKTPFKLLHNATETITVKDTKLNICGLGEHSLDRVNPKEAFKNYDKKYPGIILLHNPDGITKLHGYPGEIILSGHTHGGQVNLPWFWKKFTLLENMDLKRGLVHKDNKWIYINRGIGSILPFRWFAIPEILLLTLRKHAPTTH